MRRRAIVLAVPVLAAALMVAALAGGRSARPEAEHPLVLAAASLTEVLPRIASEGRFSFAGSNQLAQQIRQGARFDVFVSASRAHTRALHGEGLVRRPVPFATNDLVVIVPRLNPARIAALPDLARRPTLRLVVAGPEVPIGLYTREVLQRVGLLRVLRRTVSLEPDVKGIVGKVALGEADAGFAYVTDVAPVRDRVRVIRIPPRAQPTVVYELAVAAEPVDPEAAQDFVRAVLGPEGRGALRAAGFGLA